MTKQEARMQGAKDRAKGLANEAAGDIKQGIGKLVGDYNLRSKGKSQELKGNAQRLVGDKKDAPDPTGPS
jgi:uncharacterized protein YjbJ (UPF0337 family)